MPYGKGTYGNQVGRPKKVRPTGGPGNGKKMKPLGNSGSSAVLKQAKKWKP